MEKTKDKKIAIVTGANRGLGLEVSKQLVEKNYHVIMTSRKQMDTKVIPSNCTWHALDVTDEKSVKAFALFVKKTFAHVDLLINNAGVLLDFNESAMSVSLKTLRETIETNTIAPLNVSQQIIPLMSKNGIIVNVSSGLGSLVDMEGDFCPAYKISKAALNAVTCVLAFNKEIGKIKVNAVCPGWVKTDMGGAGAKLSIDEGAKNILAAAFLDADGPTGKFFSGGKVENW